MVKKKKSRRRQRKAMGKQKRPLSGQPSISLQPQDIAIRLLYIQQRIESLERLYNEEVSSLKKDVSDINMAFVRQAQAQGRLEELADELLPPEPEDDELS
ncbi:MAG TPA: hypothetical protein VF812_10280 [Ktedonobacterales bacterium]